MFPSSNNGADRISRYSDKQAYNNNNTTFFNDITLTSSEQDQEPLPNLSSFFQLRSSPFIFHELEQQLEEKDVFQQNQDLLLRHHHHHHHQTLIETISTTSTSASVVNNMEDTNNNKNEVVITKRKSQHIPSEIPRKRSCKRDRHSKINTAQGPRDRRMRLSLKVARKFFDLQDKLGFDKGSKTVEWLLIQAEDEIKKLSGPPPQANYSYSGAGGGKSASSASECEVVSGIMEEAAIKASISKEKSNLRKEKKKKSTKPSRKASIHPVARESREKARARARERTREKMRGRRVDEPKISVNNNSSEEARNNNQELSSQLTCWSPFETGEEESGTQSRNMNPNNNSTEEAQQVAEIQAQPTSSHEQHQFGITPDAMIDDNSLMMIMAGGRWLPSPSPIFNQMQNPGISQEHPYFTDFQSLYKPWEDYNNIQSPFR